MREDGASFEQASEFFSYNTERALTYLPKDVRPIIATKGF